MTSRKVRTQEEIHSRIMRFLQKIQDITLRELAENLGMTLGSLNYCIKDLIYKGIVKLRNFHKIKNKFKYVYQLTPQGIAEKVPLTNGFLKHKIKEYEALQAEIVKLRSEVQKSGGEGTQKA